MFKKDTEKLLAEIKSDADMQKFLERNQAEFTKPLHEFLNQLLQEKNLSKAEVIKNSALNINYAYHIFLGKRKNPSRDKIIALGLAMQLNLEELQYLLRYAAHGALYPRNTRDAILISAVEQNLSVADTNSLLENFGANILD